MTPPDYMSRPEEMAKQPDALACIQAIAKAAGPERETQFFNAAWSFWNFGHAWDDLVDESKWDDSRKELAWRALLEFVADLLTNPVYRDHAHGWSAMFASAVARNLDGDEMARSVNRDRAALAPAVRCADVDILVHFAYLAGGWEMMRSIGRRRDYDTPEQKGAS